MFSLLGLSGGKGGCPRVSTQGSTSATSDKFYFQLNETFFGGGDRGQYCTVQNWAGLVAHDPVAGLAINRGLGSMGSGRIGFDVAGGRVGNGERGGVFY